MIELRKKKKRNSKGHKVRLVLVLDHATQHANTHNQISTQINQK